jgi:predicted tellurium resistance membrane protein TerC
MEGFSMADAISVLLLLIALELVLGIDNIVVVTIAVSRLPAKQRQKARVIGLALALVARFFMIWLFFVLANLEEPLIHLPAPVDIGLSVKDLVLLLGGVFLIWKAIKEMHHTIDLQDDAEQDECYPSKASFSGALAMIVAVDLVFSLDSVITAVGLTDHILVIFLAVVVSFAAVLLFAKTVGEFILANPTFKILALSFLVTIGVVLFAEGMHHHIPKPYIYLPMAFATAVQVLQWKMEQNRRRRKLAAKAR